MSSAIALVDAGVRVLDCEHKTPAARSEGHPYIAIPDIQNGRVLLDQSRRISDDDLAEWTRRTVPAVGDILVTRRGRVGDSAPVPDTRCAIGQNLVLLRSDGENVDPKYLRWAARSPQWWVEVDRLMNVGAVFNSLNVKDIGQIRLPFPPLAEQQAIARVLGALDDKIAANSAVAQKAEALASLTYDTVTASWARTTMSDVLEPMLGGTPPRSQGEYWNDGTELWISARDITSAPMRVVADTAEKITTIAVAKTKAKPLPAGSVILTARGTVGEVGRLAQPCSFNQSCYGFRPDVVPPALLYFSVLRACERARSIAHGSVFDTITKTTFDHLAISWEPESAGRAEDEVGPLLAVVEDAIGQNRTLAATRDALLPQLMSGKLRVGDAERAAVKAGA